MKKTKIVATIGPATESVENLERLFSAGVNIFRMNLKHNTHDWHAEIIKRIRTISDKKDIKVGILADLQGPELRIAGFNTKENTVNLLKDQIVTLIEKFDQKSFKTTDIEMEFPKIQCVENLSKGMDISIDDGKIVLEVLEIKPKSIKAKVIDGGELSIKKSISIPEAFINVETLTEKDLGDIDFAVKANVDLIALSFVRDAKDIATLRKEIKKRKGTQMIIAKIENLMGVNNIEEIMKETDGVMVARGDLGIEVPMERVPSIQQKLIIAARHESKPVIVATQMLMSMVREPTPTRAEVSDIAHAVFDGTDALMLSEETTAGNFPIKAVEMMAKTAKYNENHSADTKKFVNDLFQTKTFEELLIESSIKFSQEESLSAESSKVKGYMVFTESGKSARLLSRYRTHLPVFSFATSDEVCRQLCLSFGVQSFNLKLKSDPVDNIKNALKLLKETKRVDKGDKLIIIFGSNVGEAGGNNTLSIVTVD